MPETPTGPLIRAAREQYQDVKSDVSEIREDVHEIRKILLGNGRGGLVERVALLEQTAGIGRYLVTALVGVGAAILTALLLRGLP